MSEMLDRVYEAADAVKPGSVERVGTHSLILGDRLTLRVDTAAEMKITSIWIEKVDLPLLAAVIAAILEPEDSER